MDNAEFDDSATRVVDGLAAVVDRRERRGVVRLSWVPELPEALRRRAEEELRSDPAAAFELARVAVVAARCHPDGAVTVATLRTYAQAALQRGHFRTALRALDRATARSCPEAKSADLAALRVQCLVPLERYEEARVAAERGLATYEQEGSWQGTVRCRLALGDLAFRRDRNREALSHYARAEAVLPPDTPPRIRGILALNRANSLEAVNRFRAAARHFEIARNVFSGCEHTLAQVDNNAAYGAMLRGHYEEALRLYAATEPVFARLKDERHLAHIDLERAEIHLHLNLPEEVAENACSAERRFSSLGLAKECAQSTLLAGRGNELGGDPRSAEEAYLRAEASFADLGLEARRMECVLARAGSLMRRGENEEARRLAREAEVGLRDGAYPLLSAQATLTLARLDLADGDAPAAERRAREAIEATRRIHAPWLAVDAWRIAGAAAVALARYESAVDSYRRSIEILEEFRGGVPPDEYMAAFLAAKTGIYEEAVDLLVRMGDAPGAFEIAERAKARALVDLLAGRRRPGSAAALGMRDTSPRLRLLRDRLTAVYGRLFSVSGEGDERSVRAARTARKQAGEIESEIGRILMESRLRDPEAVSLETADTPDLESVRRDLGSDATLIEYFTTEESTFIFVVTASEVEVVRLDRGARHVGQLLHRFRFHLARLQRNLETNEDQLLAATRANLEKLSALLLEPIRDRLRTERIVVVPHGILHHVPFHALPLNAEWVADRYEVVYAPSAAVYRFCGERRPSATEGAAVFALPDERAPRIADEAASIESAVPGCRVHMGGAATMDLLGEEARRARFLHIATHGMFRHRQPMLSSIRLADGWVNLYDLYRLRFAGELIVLSSCESGTADVTEGNEILGLTRGFLYAGAPALLTTQWRVNDAVTTEFMGRFYRLLGECGDAAEAHRRAMADIRARHPHPYYWAPFFLTGRPVTASKQKNESGQAVTRTAERSKPMVSTGSER